MVSSFLTTAFVALFSAVQLLPVAAAVDTTDGGLSWTIYHSWNPNQEFVRRGSLIWGSNSDSEGKNVFQIVNDDASADMTAKDIQDMLEYGWYHVKIQGDKDSNFVFQTVPACNLRRANFKDQFEISLPRSSLGDKEDAMTSFAYTPLVSPLAPKTCAEYGNEETTRSFSSRVSVQLDTPAMALKSILPPSKPPPGIAFAKQPKQPGQSGGGESYDGEPPANPTPFGFLSKYWYIILPMLIMQMITVPAEDENMPQQGQQQQQQGGNAGGTIAPPASSQKARRGKTSKNKQN